MYCKSESYLCTLLLLAFVVTVTLVPALAHSKRGYFGGVGQSGQGGLQGSNKNFPWVPIPWVTVRPTTATTTAAGGALTAVDRVALELINSFRATHQAPVVTYNTTLKTLAKACASKFATDNAAVTLPFVYPSCAGAATAGLTIGYNTFTSTNGARAAISDPFAGWFGEYVNYAGTFPPTTFVAAIQDYTQMIWVASTEVGCDFSTAQVMLNDNVNPVIAVYIYMCLWTPAGNVPATFADNCRAEV